MCRRWGIYSRKSILCFCRWTSCMKVMMPSEVISPCWISGANSSLMWWYVISLAVWWPPRTPVLGQPGSDGKRGDSVSFNVCDPALANSRLMSLHISFFVEHVLQLQQVQTAAATVCDEQLQILAQGQVREQHLSFSRASSSLS